MVNIAVLGFGTVCSGVYEIVTKNKDVITRKAGMQINIKYVLDLREFPDHEVNKVLTHNVDDILNDESIQVVGDIGLITLDKKGEIINTYTYQNDIRFIWDGSRNYILALENIVDANDTDILIFSDEGEVKSQAKINGEAIDVFCDGNQIVLLDKNNIYEYNTSLELLNTYPNLNKYVEVAVYGGKIYGMSSERLDKIGEN